MKMSSWLGEDFKLKKQPSGDLTIRLLEAFKWIRRNDRFLAIASDTPNITPQILKEAFNQFKSGKDVVVGPTIAGGYYLIGINGDREKEKIFSGLPDITIPF